MQNRLEIDIQFKFSIKTSIYQLQTPYYTTIIQLQIFLKGHPLIEKSENFHIYDRNLQEFGDAHVMSIVFLNKIAGRWQGENIWKANYLFFLWGKFMTNRRNVKRLCE